jgi:tRNA(Arg) A34 adenosine deaminase TadA
MACAGGGLAAVVELAAAPPDADNGLVEHTRSNAKHNRAVAPEADNELVRLFLRMFDECVFCCCMFDECDCKSVSERFLRVLKEAEAKQSASTASTSKMEEFFRSSQVHCKESKEPWTLIKKECYKQLQKKDSIKHANPLESFIFWLTTHCCITHTCAGMEYMKNFVERKPPSLESDEKMAKFLRILHEFRFVHFPERDFSKQKYVTQCIFDGEQHHYLLSLCDCETRNALQDFVQTVTKSSDLNARWLRRETGRSFKLWGRMSKREYDPCEVVKCSADNKGHKWRHMIYAYAIMELLWSEYNGNKEGPLGDYPGRRGSEIGRMIEREEYERLLALLEHDNQTVPREFIDPRDLLKTLRSAEYVFPSKAGSGLADYNGHNIVALAVGKRGEILRISFNHNTLFSSTVDHAEERLIDGLYKDPEAFVQMSHARIYDSKLGLTEKMEVEKHMRHISVYTSLEPCQQCSGKFHIALVPEVIFCQRDWEIELLQGQLYERHHKCRPIPASFFGFTPYEELAIAYNHFCQKIRTSKDGVTFFRQQALSKSDKVLPPVLAKQTMPYFLCSNEAQLIFMRGSIIFTKLLHVLFKGPESDSLKKDEFFNWPCIDSDSKFQEYKDEFMELFNVDVSDWTSSPSPSPTKDDFDSQWSSDYFASPSVFVRTSSGTPLAQPAVIKNSNACWEIRQFRPSLNAKQNRLSQDELISLRGVWIGNMFKQRRTLMFQFDRYSGITEKDIDTHISPLGEIEGIYLGRSLDGTLKGTFDVTFASFDVARALKLTFDKIEWVKKTDGSLVLRKEKKGKEGDSDPIDPRIPQKVIIAAEWLFSVRKPGPKEIFVPKALSESMKQKYSDFVEEVEHFHPTKPMKRQFPWFKAETDIHAVNCKNVAGKRRLQQFISGCPLIRLLRPGKGTRHLAEENCRFTLQSLSIIARIDVSEEELLVMIQKCYVRPGYMKLKELPAYFTPESSRLSTCNSSATLNWLDVRENHEPEMKHWNLWSVRFRAEAEFDLGPLQSSSGEDEQNRFCQPFSQSIFDFAVFVEERSPFFIRWDPAKFPAASADEKSGTGFVLRIVFTRTTLSNINGERKKAMCTPAEANAAEANSAEANAAEARPAETSSAQKLSDDFLDLKFTGTKFVRVNSQSRKTKVEGCVMEMNENSVSALLFCGMLGDARIKFWCDFWVKRVLQERTGASVIVKQLDFWGREATLRVYNSKSSGQGIEASFLEQDCLFSAKSFIDGLHSISHAFTLEQSAPNAALHGLAMTGVHSQIFCQYCGLRSAIDNSILNHFKSHFKSQSISACCIGHFPSQSIQPESTNDGGEKKGLKLNVMQKVDSPAFIDPVKDNGAGNALIKIKKLENDLFLSINVKSLTLHAATLQNSHFLFMLHLRLYRDEFDGPAFIAFCIDSSGAEQSAVVDVRIAIHSANFSGSGIISTTAESVSSIAITGTTAEQPNQQFKFNEKLTRVHGKLLDDNKPPSPEGRTIPANDLRYFFEPEYFPQLHETELGSVHVPAYPTIDIFVKTQRLNLPIPVHTWNFEEFQTKKLEELMAIRRKLIEATFFKEKREQEQREIKCEQLPLDYSTNQWSLRLDSISDQSILFATLSVAKSAESTEKDKQYRIPVHFSPVSSVLRDGSFQKESLDQMIICAKDYSTASHHGSASKKKKGEFLKELNATFAAYFNAIKQFLALSSDMPQISGTKTTSLKKSTTSFEDLFFNYRDSLCSNFPDVYFAPLVALLAEVLASHPLSGNAQRQEGFCDMMSKMFHPERNQTSYEALEEFRRIFFQFFEFIPQTPLTSGGDDVDTAVLEDLQGCGVASGAAAAGAEVGKGGGCVPEERVAAKTAFKDSDLWAAFADKKMQKDIKAELPIFAAQLIHSIMLASGGVSLLHVVEPQTKMDGSNDDLIKLCKALCLHLPDAGVKYRDIKADAWGIRLKKIRLQQDINNIRHELDKLTERWELLVKECLRDFGPAEQREEEKKTKTYVAADVTRDTDVQTLEAFKFFVQENLFDKQLIDLVRTVA